MRFLFFFSRYASFFFLLISLFLLSGCSQNELLFKYWNKKGNTQLQQELYDASLQSYRKAQEKSERLSIVAEYNATRIPYLRGEMESALHQWSELEQKYCSDDVVHILCPLVWYNKGNTLYRLGETKRSWNEKVSLWEQAIEKYDRTLSLTPDDVQAQENKIFIEEQLKNPPQSSDEGDQQMDGDGGENEGEDEEGEGEGGGSSPSSDENEKEGSGGAENSEESNENESSSDQENSSEDNESSDGGSEENKSENESSQDQKSPFSPEVQRQLQQYQQELMQQEQSFEEYHNRNPHAAQSQMNNPLWNDLWQDPFFRQFLGNQLPPQFQSPTENDPVEKDW